MARGRPGKSAKVSIDRAPFTSTSFKSVWRLWLNSDYLGRNFYIYLPPEGSRAEQFRVHLRLIRWHWIIVGVELPDELREQLARELIELTQERVNHSTAAISRKDNSALWQLVQDDHSARYRRGNRSFGYHLGIVVPLPGMWSGISGVPSCGGPYRASAIRADSF